MQMHRMDFHALVPQPQLDQVPPAGDDRVGVRVPLAVDAPDLGAHHPAAQHLIERPGAAGGPGQALPATRQRVGPESEAVEAERRRLRLAMLLATIGDQDLLPGLRVTRAMQERSQAPGRVARTSTP